MTNDVDTLATALYATTDDMLKEHPDLAPWRPSVGITPRLSDAGTLAMMRAIVGFASEAEWLRHARAHLRPRHATRPRADRRDLAPRRHRTNRPTLTDRLRSLTP
uniref:hypothetical protein n=1 Tax=Actinacidiphila glaucinigra TaxID=235986 RepID=UPI00396A4AA4